MIRFARLCGCSKWLFHILTVSSTKLEFQNPESNNVCFGVKRSGPGVRFAHVNGAAIGKIAECAGPEQNSCHKATFNVGPAPQVRLPQVPAFIRDPIMFLLCGSVRESLTGVVPLGYSGASVTGWRGPAPVTAGPAPQTR